MRTRKSKVKKQKQRKTSVTRHEETQTISNKLKFQQEVERLRKGGLTMLEAIQEYCEAHSIEPESIPRMLTPAMLDHLHSEAQEFNLVKRVNQVDI